MVAETSSFDSEEIQTRGQDLYRQGHYRDALKVFASVSLHYDVVLHLAHMALKAIRRKDEVPLSLLDNRAATHAKLGHFQAALVDGRSMIRRYRTNSTVGNLPVFSWIKSSPT